MLHLLDAGHELGGTAVGKVVAVHRGDHHVLEAKAGDRFPQPFRFGGIELTNALVEIDVAVGAGAGAARPHDQKGGGAASEALTDVGAAGFLADRVQLQVEQQVGNGADPFPLRGFDAQPLGLEHG